MKSQNSTNLINRMFHYFRDPISGLTHALGAVLSVVGLIFLLYEGFQAGKLYHMIAFLIFGLSMVALYTSSSLYHLLNGSESLINRLRKLDHSMIYVLIAGTYTPLCLIALDGGWRWGLFSTIWGLTAVGIIVKLFWMNAPRWLSTLFYLFMGWIAVLIFPKLSSVLPTGAFAWIVIGGAAYTIGAIIYAIKKPDPIPNIFGFHEIWHLFVMAGTFSHFWAIYDYLPGF